MTETEQILAETAGRIFSGSSTVEIFDKCEDGTWPSTLWDELEAAGLTRAATSEERGGFGGDLENVYTLIKSIGMHSAPVPLVETLLAERILAAAELPAVAGPATIGPTLRGDRLKLERSGRSWKLSGTLRRVPWGRHAKTIVALADHEGKVVTVIVQPPAATVIGTNLAGEPRDTFLLDSVTLRQEAVGRPGKGWDFEKLFLQGALSRTVAMSGALETVRDLTIRYAKERVQFGRPIGKFQAVQQQIAVLATQVAASSAATQAAVSAAMIGPATFEIAAAKTRVSEAAGISAAIAHQVHGAMGFSYEHTLHRSTRRLWSWRDEFGSETEWALWIGRAITKVGGDNLWALITAHEKEHVLAQ